MEALVSRAVVAAKMGNLGRIAGSDFDRAAELRAFTPPTAVLAANAVVRLDMSDYPYL